MSEKYDLSPLSRRLLSTFNISNEILTKLTSKGFTLKSEIQYLSDSRIKSICDLNETQLEEINRVVRNSHRMPLKCLSVKELCESSLNPIHTGIYSLDRAIGGGLQVSKITQISAEGGAGKTQICMQCCVNVQLPPKYGGLSGQALYIDTEDNIRPERIISMAAHRISTHPDLMTTLSPQIINSRIHVFSCRTNSEDLVDLVVNRIQPFIDENPKIRLVVIDSIAQHFRYDYKGTEAQKDYELALIAHKLREIAHSKKVAVLISNQVTFNASENKNVPALGKQWQTLCNTGVFFSKFGNVGGISYRNGRLVRTNEIDSDTCFWFHITENGIEELVPGRGEWNDSSNEEQMVEYKPNGIVF